MIDLDGIRDRLSIAMGIGLDESVARHYRQDVPALVAEVERLRAFEPTDEQLERTARMLFRRTHEGRNGFSWPLNGERDQQRDIEDARRFLTHAMNGPKPSDSSSTGGQL